tara:strand:+ start:874 stop:1182 length:309 start_codon:yes stop_codon:yes gene_type:complete
MNQIEEIIQRVKELTGATTDTAVADQLKITRQDLAHHKRRDSVPYKKIIEFCGTSQHSADYLFFGIKPEATDERIKELELKLEKEKYLLAEIKKMMTEMVRQ